MTCKHIKRERDREAWNQVMLYVKFENYSSSGFIEDVSIFFSIVDGRGKMHNARQMHWATVIPPR